MAVTVADTLVEITPTDAELWMLRAVAVCQVGRMQEAHAALVIAFELQPKCEATPIREAPLASVRP